jgi:predicted ATPase
MFLSHSIVWADRIPQDLYSYAMEAANLLSDEEVLSCHLAKINLLSDRPMMDKMRAFKAWIAFLVRQKYSSKAAAGLEFAIDLLGKLGVTFPKRKTTRLFALVGGLIRLKSRAKALTVDESVNDTRPVDPKDFQAMQILSLAMEACFLTQPDLLPLWILKMAEISFRNGVCAYTQAAYAQLGMVFRLVKEYQLAAKMAEITEILLSTYNYDVTWGQASYQIYAFPLPYVRPYHKLLPRLMDSYTHSLAIGDLSAVGGALVFLCYMQLAAGTNLRMMNSDCRRYIHQLNGEFPNLATVFHDYSLC